MGMNDRNPFEPDIRPRGSPFDFVALTENGAAVSWLARGPGSTAQVRVRHVTNDGALGAATVVVEYSLCPHVTVGAIVRQLQSACAWVWNNIDEYGGDHHRIYLVGNSAGGHLSAMLASTEWPEVDHALPADQVKGAMSLSGLFDLEPLLLHSVNETLKLEAAAAKRNSPALKKPRLNGPFIAAVGGDESKEFIRQSRALVEAWKPHHADLEFVEVAGRNHFSIVGDYEQSDYVLLRKLKHMLET